MAKPATNQLAAGVTFEPDPISALAEWTVESWGAQVWADPEHWTPASTTPGVFWRLVRAEEVERLAWGSRVELTIRGHVLHPLADARVEWIRRVFEALLRTRRLVLSDGAPLDLRAPTFDADLDPLRVGQISVIGRFSVKRPAEAAERLRHATGRATTGGTVEVDDDG
jgi:hypothetical protein